MVTVCLHILSRHVQRRRKSLLPCLFLNVFLRIKCLYCTITLIYITHHHGHCANIYILPLAKIGRFLSLLCPKPNPQPSPIFQGEFVLGKTIRELHSTMNHMLIYYHYEIEKGIANYALRPRKMKRFKRSRTRKKKKKLNLTLNLHPDMLI